MLIPRATSTAPISRRRAWMRHEERHPRSGCSDPTVPSCARGPDVARACRFRRWTGCCSIGHRCCLVCRWSCAKGVGKRQQRTVGKISVHHDQDAVPDETHASRVPLGAVVVVRDQESRITLNGSSGPGRQPEFGLDPLEVPFGESRRGQHDLDTASVLDVHLTHATRARRIDPHATDEAVVRLRGHRAVDGEGCCHDGPGKRDPPPVREGRFTGNHPEGGPSGRQAAVSRSTRGARGRARGTRGRAGRKGQRQGDPCPNKCRDLRATTLAWSHRSLGRSSPPRGS